MANKNECPTLLMTHILGKKWTVPIVEEVYFSNGSAQFNAIKRSVSSITTKTLNDSLRELCTVEVLKKHTSRYNNVKYTKYTLTEKGRDLERLIQNMKKLGICWYGMQKGCETTKCSSCPLFNGKGR